MDIDIGFWLTLAVLFCGALWLADRIAGLRERGEKIRETVEFFNSLLPVFLVVLVIRSFIVEPFTIPSGSMLPTLQVHDFVLVNRFAYGLRLPVTNTKVIPVGEPERGDVMVFRYPRDPSINFIKRVVGLPGDRVEVRDGRVYVNGEQVEHELLRRRRGQRAMESIYLEKLEPQSHLIRREVPLNPFTGEPVYNGKEGSWTVPEDAYFVLGDNRNNSKDSRFWGMVPDRLVLGKAFLIWMHWEPIFSWPDFSRNGPIDQESSWEAEQ
jgi:signal peptidase I